MRVLFTSIALVTIAMSLPASLVHASEEVKSPDRNIILTYALKDFEGDTSCPVYSVTYKGKTIVTESRLGFHLDGGPLKSGFKIVKQSNRSQDTHWKPVYGERSTIRDQYNQTIVDLKEIEAPHRLLQITFRVYDQGAAFCYTFPTQDGINKINITKEISEFRFPADHTAWATYTAQGKYSKVPLSQITAGCERPLPIKVADNVYAALAEARLVDYARTKFSPLEGKPNSLVTDLGSKVEATVPLRTPWRVIMLADSPGRLLENNFIILNLNDPCAIADTSWIKPGKVIREGTLSTLGGKACIDFAVKNNLQYFELDAGWYGNDRTGDPRAVNVKPDRAQGPLDLQEVIRYGKEHGIGVILYVDRGPLEKHIDEILPLYQKWGVKGVKYGFVNVGSQKWTAWLHDAIRKAADYQLMVDVHDEYRSTGWTRTYPHLMTEEGIRGDEEKQENSMNLTTLFGRMLAGSADVTICYYDPRVNDYSTHAYQLAKSVCFYSPWQFLYWYDRPYISPKVTPNPKANNVIGDEPELEFFAKVPTVWDDTKVLQGEIGEYAVIARRSGDNWFIGCMNSGQPRILEAPLKFLDEGKKYTAYIYSDDPALPTRTHVKIEHFSVDRDTVLKASVSSQGGQAIRISPAAATDDYPNYQK